MPSTKLRRTHDHEEQVACAEQQVTRHAHKRPGKESPLIIRPLIYFAVRQPQQVGERTLHRRAFFAVDIAGAQADERPVSWLPLSSLPCCIPPTRLFAPPPSGLPFTKAVSTTSDPTPKPQAGVRCLSACGTAQLLSWLQARCVAAACALRSDLANHSWRNAVSTAASQSSLTAGQHSAAVARAEDANLLVLRRYQTNCDVQLT